MFTVSLTIEIDSDTPQHAAEQFRRTIMDADSIPLQFVVHDDEKRMHIVEIEADPEQSKT